MLAWQLGLCLLVTWAIFASMWREIAQSMDPPEPYYDVWLDHPLHGEVERTLYHEFDDAVAAAAAIAARFPGGEAHVLATLDGETWEPVDWRRELALRRAPARLIMETASA